MKVIQFIINQGQATFIMPFVLFICDLLVTTFLRIAFGTTRGFFVPRTVNAPKKVSVADIINSGDV